MKKARVQQVSSINSANEANANTLMLFYHPLFQEITKSFLSGLYEQDWQSIQIKFFQFIEINLMIQKMLANPFELKKAFASALNDWSRELELLNVTQQEEKLKTLDLNFHLNSLKDIKMDKCIPEVELIGLMDEMSEHSAIKYCEYSISVEVFQKFMFDISCNWCKFYDIELFCFFINTLFMGISQGDTLAKIQIKEIEDVQYLSTPFFKEFDQMKKVYNRYIKKNLKDNFKVWCEWNFQRSTDICVNLIQKLSKFFPADPRLRELPPLYKEFFDNFTNDVDTSLVENVQQNQNSQRSPIKEVAQMKQNPKLQEEMQDPVRESENQVVNGTNFGQQQESPSFKGKETQKIIKQRNKKNVEDEDSNSLKSAYREAEKSNSSAYKCFQKLLILKQEQVKKTKNFYSNILSKQNEQQEQKQLLLQSDNQRDKIVIKSIENKNSKEEKEIENPHNSSKNHSSNIFKKRLNLKCLDLKEELNLIREETNNNMSSLFEEQQEIYSNNKPVDLYDSSYLKPSFNKSSPKIKETSFCYSDLVSKQQMFPKQNVLDMKKQLLISQSSICNRIHNHLQTNRIRSKVRTASRSNEQSIPQAISKGNFQISSFNSYSPTQYSSLNICLSNKASNNNCYNNSFTNYNNNSNNNLNDNQNYFKLQYKESRSNSRKASLMKGTVFSKRATTPQVNQSFTGNTFPCELNLDVSSMKQNDISKTLSSTIYYNNSSKNTKDIPLKPLHSFVNSPIQGKLPSFRSVQPQYTPQYRKIVSQSRNLWQKYLTEENLLSVNDFEKITSLIDSLKVIKSDEQMKQICLRFKDEQEEQSEVDESESDQTFHYKIPFNRKPQIPIMIGTNLLNKLKFYK